jgi:hypothetical protein
MKSKRTILKAAATLVAAAFSFPAVAGCNTAKPPADLFTEKDAWRFSQLVESRTRGLALAVSSDRTADRKKLSEALVDLYPDKDEERPKHAADRLVGSYGCSIIKLGGLPPLVAYQAFRCEIHSGKNGLVIEKTTGSQQFYGRLIASGNGFAYAGTLRYQDETTTPYGNGPERDQAGCLAVVSPYKLVLELPYPHYEAVHDIVVLKRR